jgi:hypothetical protein
MSAILYKLVDGQVVSERVAPVDVANLLENGYFTSPELAQADTNESGKLSSDEVREAAKAAGIKGWDKARISTLKKKLDEQD